MADTPSQAQSGLQVLEAGDLAKVSAPSAKTPNITNQSVLDDMQKLYEQKLAEKNYFMQDLADAQAWWSGGAAGPTSGLALRAQTRAQQAKELQDLQMALSQGKVNIAQLGAANATLGEPQAGIAGLPTGGAQTSTGAQTPAGTQTPAGGYTIRGVPVPVQVYKAYQAYLQQGNLAKANEVFEKYAVEESKFLTAPGTYKQEDYFDEATGQMKRRTPLEVRGATPISTARSALAASVSDTVPTTSTQPSAVTPTTQPTTVTPTSARVTDQGDVYRFENLSDSAKQRLNEYARTELGLKGDAMNRADASELFNKMPMEQRKNAFLKSGETPVTAQASAPTQMAATTPTTTGAPTTKPQTYSDYLTKQAGEKSYAEKSEAKAGEAAGTRQGAFESKAVDAGSNLQNANVMLNIIDQHPEAVGLGYKNRALGATIEGIKLLTGKDVEPFARRATLSNEAIEAGNKFDSLAERNNLEFRQSVMKGTGQVSDFETKLTERASGLSKDNSVEANRFFATVAAENYRTLDKLGREWQTYQKQNPGAKFSQFEQSDVWKNAQVEREARLKKYFPEIERGDIGFGSRAPGKGVDDAEMEGFRKRYGTQKGNQ